MIRVHILQIRRDNLKNTLFPDAVHKMLKVCSESGISGRGNRRESALEPGKGVFRDRCGDGQPGPLGVNVFLTGGKCFPRC